MPTELDGVIPDNSDAEKVDQLHTSQEFAASRSPEDAAGTFNYAKAAGLSFDQAETQKKTLPLPAPSWGSLVKDHPVLSRYLSDPGFAATAQDDVQNLSKLERLFGGWDEIAWKSKQALADDSRNQELAAIGRAMRAGTATKEQLARGDELEKEAESDKTHIGFVPGIVPSVIGGLPGMARALPTAAYYGVGGAIGGLLLTRNPKVAAGAAGGMAGAGFVAGMALDTAKTEQGLSYRQYVKAGADPASAAVASDIVALANGGLQAIPAEKVLNVVPGLRAILQGKATRDIMGRLIGSNTGRAVLARFAGRVAESGLLMALVGSGQELVKEVGAIGAGADDKLHGDRIWNAATGGAQQGLGFGFAHAALPAVAEKRQATLGEGRTEMFKAIGGITSESKLRERMPAEFKAYANDVIKEHGAVAEVKLPADKLGELFQKEGIDPTTVQEQMPEVAKQMRESKPGDEIVVPTADLATHLAHLKSFPEILPDLRYGEELTARESKEAQKEGERIAAQKPKETDEPATPERRVYEDVYQKLVDAGQAPEVAQHDAGLWAAFAKARGERTGVDPFDYYSKRSLSIGAEMGDISLGQKYKPGETYKFPIKNLKLDDQNFREAEANVRRGQGSQTEGPIKLYRREGSRKLEVGDGHHRIIEALQRGESEIDGRIEKDALPRELPQLLGEPESPSRGGGEAPSADFEKGDLQDGDTRVDEEAIRKTYGGSKNAAIYRAYVPFEDLPSPKLAEEMEKVPEEDRATYPWEDFDRRGTFPPAKLKIKKDGTIEILDGNHRLKWWEEAGFTHAPAWVIDERKNAQKALESRREEDLYQPAYHGSPYRFDKFTLDHIGSGEGAQIYGHGLYFAEEKAVADYYRNALSHVEVTLDGEEQERLAPKDALAPGRDAQSVVMGRIRALAEAKLGLGHDDVTPGNVIDEVQKDIVRGLNASFNRLEELDKSNEYRGIYGKKAEETKKSEKNVNDSLSRQLLVIDELAKNPERVGIKRGGGTYEVDLPEKHELLDFDQKFKAQPEKVRAALQKNAPEIFEKASSLNFTGEELYHDLARQLGSDRAASEALLKAGVPGLKYLDEGSRGKGVVFYGEKPSVWAPREVLKDFVNGLEDKVKEGNSIEDAFQDQLKEVKALAETHEGARAAVDAEVKRVRDEERGIAKDRDKMNALGEAQTKAYRALKTLEWIEEKSVTAKDFQVDEGTHNFVIWDENAIKTLNVLEQQTEAGGGYRGKISFDKARSYFRVTLTGKANLSTFLHESGHAFFEFVRKDAEEGHAGSLEDFNKLREWLGVKDGEEPSVDQLETFAKGFETYLAEGKAPAAGLRDAFRAFKTWLKLVYKSISNLGVNLTDDVRGVMDRMLATDGEIEEARQNLGFEPMEKPKEMPEGEYTAYKERFAKAVQKSRDELEAQALKEFSKTIGEERAKVRGEVEEATKADPVHNAYEALRTGKRLDGEPIPEEIQGKKLSREAVREFPGYSDTKKWTAITSPDGLDPEVAAPYYGFKNGQEMLEKLAARQSRTKEIKEQTDARMKERYPDAEMGKMAEQAVKAVHNEDVTDVLWKEAETTAKYLTGLEAQANKDKPPLRFQKAVIKETAKRRVEGMTMLEMQPGRFARAEERAAGDSAKAFKKGDFEEAQAKKLEQIANHELWKRVSDAKEEVNGIRDYLAKFEDLSTRRRIGKAGQMYLNAIDKLLEDVDLKKVSNKDLSRRASLESYLKEIEDEGGTVSIPNDLRSEAGLKNFKQMTLEDLRAVNDAVANIEAMARLKNRIFDGRENRNFQETATKGGEHIRANLGTPFAEKPGAPQNPGWWEQKKSWLRESRAEKKKIEFIARELDGGQTAGLMHNLLFQPFATAAGKMHEWTKKVTEELIKPLREMTFKERVELDKTVDFLGTPMKLRDVIAVALNMGNDGNKKKLLEGYGYRGWDEEKVTQRLGELLTDKHLDLIQHFWTTINSLWPEIKALSERTTGVAPPKVDAAKLYIRGRELEGGYYPVVYDRDRSYKAEQIAQRKGDLFENNFLKPGVSKGFTEARTQFSAPILLSLNVIPSHINEVIHYLTHYEPVRAVDRLLAHSEMRQAVTEGLGRETYNLFRPWLQAIAHDGVIPNNLTGVDNILRHLRVGAAVTRLGFRLTNSIMQGFNLLSSYKELGGTVSGTKYLGLGIKRWMEDLDSFRDPFAHVIENSPEIAGKTKNMERELIANFDHYTSAFSEFGHMKERLGHFAMSFMTLAWRTCDTITWYAAREKAFDEAHPRPNEYADSVVRLAQMGEGMKDKAAIMRGGEGTRIFTNMYSWYSTIYNQLTETQPQTRGGWAKAGELASRWWWMVLAPTVLMGLSRGKGPKKDQDEAGSWLKFYGEEIALEAAKPWPVAGVVADTLLSEHESRFGPWISTVLRGVKARGKMMAGEKLTEHEKQDLVQSTGITSHLPATALWNAYKYVSAVQDGKLEEPIRDLLFRAPGEWK